ncbi:MAG: hypothetical protein WD607_04315 [Candidatus Paceibacterota bacterium]
MGHESSPHMLYELLRAGVSIYTVQRWLRHSDVKTTQRYADLLNMDISDQVGRVF